jgi:uncharacterized protein with beta-barrel porin domain
MALDLSEFAVLAGSTITNTGTTTINGNIGLSPGTAVPGVSSIVLTGGTVHVADAIALQAKNDLTTAFNVLMGRPSTAIAGDLGGQTLIAGVYSFSSSAQLTGTLTLNGGPNDIFIIQVATSLTTASGSAVLLIGGAQAKNVFFVVGSSATLGTSTAFVGQILAGASISLETSATILCGAALAQSGAVTLDSNTINRCIFTATTGAIEDILDDDITQNGGSIADAIDDYVANGGTLPLSFQILALLSPTELAAALEEMSGEVGTGVTPATEQGMDSFLSLITTHGDSLETVTGQPGDTPETGRTVSVMGYAPTPDAPGAAAFADFDNGPLDGSNDWTIWASAFGGSTTTDGDALVGSHERTIQDAGIAIGFDRQVSPDTLVGVAISSGRTSFSLSDDLGSGDAATLQAAVYARSSFDQAYLSGALAIGHNQVSTSRWLTFAGADHFTADFATTSLAGQIEAGYDLGWLTPYAGLRVQRTSSPAYSETTEAGVSTFALDYEEATRLTVRSEVGIRAEWRNALDSGDEVALFAGLAWVHDHVAEGTTTASFQSLPGSTFVVEGASAAADSALVSAGAELALNSGLSLSGQLSGRFSDNTIGYGGSAKLSYSW